MPVREIKTTIALDGEQQFKKAIADATREMRVMDSELKAVTEAYRTNGDSAEYYASKQRNLRSQIAQQEQIIKGLEQAVEDAGKTYGESSAQVDGYAIKLNNARAKMSQLERQLSDTDREIEELGRDSIKAGRQLEQGIGDSAEEAEKDVRGLVETLQDDLSAIRSNTAFTAVSSLWDMASGAYASVAGFVEGTVEYRRQLSFLKQNAETNGFDFTLIESQLYEVQAITGDASSAIEGLSNLMATGFDDDGLTYAVDLLAGAVISFPDTMKFETLADSLQETIATGKATGQFAELLGRLGYNVEEFNAALDNSPTAAGDLDIALAHLADGGMMDVYDQWQKNNQAMQDAGKTQAELEGELAEFGGTLEEYIVTPVKELLVEALKWVNETLEKEEKKWAEWAADKTGRTGLVDPFGLSDIEYHEDPNGPVTLEMLEERKNAQRNKFVEEALLPDVSSGEAEVAALAAQAADKYFGIFEREIQVNAEEAEPVTFSGPEGGILDIDPIAPARDVNELLEELGIQLHDAEPELEEAGEEAGDAMTGGFAAAWKALDNKAYMAGASMARSYADGVSSQLGAISAAANRLSAAASSALATARAGASRAVILNLDGRKVAEGLVPYTDEAMATYINFD